MNNLDKLIRDKRKYPKIICDDKELISDIGSWLGRRNNIKHEFSKILISLGFKSTDEIVLCKYDKNKFTFTYIVNGKNPYGKNIIGLNCGFIDGVPMLALNTGSRKTKDLRVYKCNRNNKNKVDNKFMMVYEEKRISNGTICRCNYSNEYADLEIEYLDGNVLKIGVESSNDVVIKNDGIYGFKWERGLVEYLVKLKDLGNIEDIYMELRRLFLRDMNKYSKFMMTIYNFNGLNNMVGKIELEYGKIVGYSTNNDSKKLVRVYDVGSYNGSTNNYVKR